MKTRNIIRTETNNHYLKNITQWLREHVEKGDDKPKGFPLNLYLGTPATDDDALAHKDEFLRFCQDWLQPVPAGHVEFVNKNYPELGNLKVPVHLIFDSVEDLASWAGHLVEYHSAVSKLDVVKKECPDLIDSAIDIISSLSNLEENDFTRFIAVAKWLMANKKSGAFIRQIPVRGIDTRWFEIHSHLLIDFLRMPLGLDPRRYDLLQLGLEPPPQMVTMRVLDHVLRGCVGGMSFLSSDVYNLEKLNLKPHRVIFIDDVQTALSLPDIAGTVAIITPTSNTSQVSGISWIANARCQYMGSIDRRSFALLHNLRLYLPSIENLNLNEEIFYRNRDLWTDDERASYSGALTALNQAEAFFYRSMVEGAYGYNVRLDLERIPMADILQVLGVKTAADKAADSFTAVGSNDSK